MVGFLQKNGAEGERRESRLLTAGAGIREFEEAQAIWCDCSIWCRKRKEQMW
jgi:hypothetical protein